MRIRELTLRNWMNFRSLDAVKFGDRVFVIGANASGKSNLLDALRFLRDLARPAGLKPSGGGLQKAVLDRGGLTKLRCLNARKDPEVHIRVQLCEETTPNIWSYEIGFKGEGKANNRIVITREIVDLNGKSILARPDKEDAKDPERLTQSFLEQINANGSFRSLAHYFSETTYLHLVPQLLKYADSIGGNVVEQDPFGQGFLQRVAATGEKIRNARLRRLQVALEYVVPQFKELRFVRDKSSGAPHIEAKFAHWRPTGAWQRESQFSDGTLRLMGLLWSLMDGNSLLLLEEPELSLNEVIVSKLPRLIAQIQRSSKTARQVVITTHSEALLSDRSIGAESVIRLQPSDEGTILKPPTVEEMIMLHSGMSVGATLLKAASPDKIDQMELTFG